MGRTLDVGTFLEDLNVVALKDALEILTEDALAKLTCAGTNLVGLMLLAESSITGKRNAIVHRIIHPVTHTSNVSKH